jgi:hypothetical protein
MVVCQEWFDQNDYLCGYIAGIFKFAAHEGHCKPEICPHQKMWTSLAQNGDLFLIFKQN